MRSHALRLPLSVLPLVLLTACLGRPSAEAQIRSLVRQSAAAANRGDAAAAYRLTDLDFRAVCPKQRYAALLQAERAASGPVRVIGIDGIVVRGDRATAEVTLHSGHGAARERRQFVKEGGRWYVYGDAAACGVESGAHSGDGGPPPAHSRVRPLRAGVQPSQSGHPGGRHA